MTDWLSGHNYRKKFTIDSDLIDGALTDFPVAIPLDLDGTDANIAEALDWTGDDFTGADASAPDTDIWGVNSGPLTIQSNALYGSISGGELYLRSAFNLSGDFDVQIDFDISAGPSTGDWYLQFLACDSAGNVSPSSDYHFQIRKQYAGTHQYATTAYDSSGWTTPDTANSADTSGKFRLTRVSNVFTGYYWTGSTWAEVGNETIADLSGDNIELCFQFRSLTGDPTLTATFDDLVINSGTVTWPTGNHPNRKKIAVTSSDGVTEQYVEIEWFGGSAAMLHTKVASISSATDTELYLYYGPGSALNTSYVGDTGDTVAQNVWDSNFKAVYHMNQDPNGDVADSIKDSTSNDNDATPDGTMLTEDLVDGQISGAKAIALDGSDDYLHTGSWTGTPQFTVEMVAIHDIDEVCCMIAKYGNVAGADQDWIFQADADQKIAFVTWEDGYESLLSINTITLDEYFYAACSFDTDDKKRIYLDDALEITSADKGGDIDQNTQPILIGSRTLVGTQVWQPGTHSEVRMSNVARSAAWLKATYHSLFGTLGALQSLTETSESIGITEDINVQLFFPYLFPVSGDDIGVDENITVELEAIIEATTSDLTVISESLSVVLPLSTAINQPIGLAENIRIALDIPTDWIALANAGLAIERYYFTLTGDADATTDIEIPIESFQAQKRTDLPTYATVVIRAYSDYLAAINARPNGQMVISMGYTYRGESSITQEIVRADVEDIDAYSGPINRSVVISGNLTESFINRSVTLETPIYRAVVKGELVYRFARCDPYLNPGDTCIVGSDSFLVDYIVYMVNDFQVVMEVREGAV